MDRRQAKDIAVIAGIATVIMGTKVLQIFPVSRLLPPIRMW